MKLTYTLGKEDYINFNLYHIQNTDGFADKLKKQRIMGTLSFLIVGLFMGMFSSKARPLILALMLIVSVFWFINFPFFAKARIKKRTDKIMDSPQFQHLFAEINLEFSEDGITEGLEDNCKQVAWDTVSKIVEQDGYKYIFFTDNSSLIIPYRALDETGLSELREIIEAHVSQEALL